MTKFKQKKLVPKRSRAGLGLFVMEPLKKGDFIIEYTGERITSTEADRRGGKYLFEISPRVTLDGKERKNLARYINHSCRPNAEAEIDRGRIFVYAKKNIPVGEEIACHYGKEYFEDIIKPHGCRCEYCTKTGRISK